MVPLAYGMFSTWYQHQYLPHPVYEVPAIRVNTSKSTYTFTSVKFGPVVQEMAFKDISYLELWRPHCSREGNHCVIFVEGIMRNNSVKIF